MAIIEPYQQAPCGCSLRMSDGVVDQVTCAKHHELDMALAHWRQRLEAASKAERERWIRIMYRDGAGLPQDPEDQAFLDALCDDDAM